LSGVTSSVNKWDSTESLNGSNNKTGLMVGNGRLMYPFPANFGTTGSAPNNPNFTSSNTLDYYTNLLASNFWPTYTNYRVYTRAFQFTTGGDRTNMFISITSSSPLSFTKVGNTLGATQGYLECKLPLASGKTGTASVDPNTTNPSTQVTGWMDCSQNANTGSHGNSDGCLVGNFTSAGSNISGTITFGGSGGTEKSGGYVLLRITLPSTSTINITSIQLS
jgi:hypothetical protein